MTAQRLLKRFERRDVGAATDRPHMINADDVGSDAEFDQKVDGRTNFLSFRVLCHHPHSERQSGFDHTADPGDSPIKASTHTCDPLVLGAIGAIERRRNIDTALREDLDDPGLADREVRIYLDELVTYMAGVTHVLLQSRMSHRLPAYKLNIVAAQNVRLVDQGLPIDSGVTTLWRRVGVTMSTPQVAVLREFEPEELEPLDRGRKTRRVFIGQTINGHVATPVCVRLVSRLQPIAPPWRPRRR